MGETKITERMAPEIVRCLCETAITSAEHEYSRQFGRGAIADLSEEIWPGVILADHVRERTFETVDPERSTAELELQVVDDSEE